MAVKDRLRSLRSRFVERSEVGLLLPPIMVLLFFAFHGIHAIGFDGLDPFGLGKASGERSEQATQRVIAPFSDPSNKVTVVLIDDDYLRTRQIGWPLSYAEQGLLLRRLLWANPAALVVDLVYPHRHGQANRNTEDTKALLEMIKENTEIPVIFTAMAREYASAESAAAADPQAVAHFLPPQFAFCPSGAGTPASLDDVLDEQSIQPDLRDMLLRRGSDDGTAQHPNWHLGLIRWSGCGNRYPLVLGGNSALVSPAYAAYREACMHRPSTSAKCGRDTLAAAGNFSEPLRIRWGAFPPWEQRFANDEHTCQPTRAADGTVSMWRRVGLAVRELTVGLFDDLRKSRTVAESLPCPSVTVVPLSLLATAPAGDWRELLQNRVVLVGANISGIPDVIVSPVHGQLPGVLLHAMAVDNLLKYGDDYPADRHREATEALAFVLVLTFAYFLPFLARLIERPRVRLVLTAISAAVWLLVIVVCAELGKWQIAATAVILAICMDLMRPVDTATYFLALTLAALLASISMLHGWPAGNWLGLVLLLLGFAHMAKAFYHGADKARLPNRHSLLGALWQRCFNFENRRR